MGSQKKQWIIETTAELLRRQGARNTSMEDIAANACVSKVTVYKYFGDRDGLLTSVCEWLTQKYLQRLMAQAAPEHAIPVRMTGFIEALTEFIGSGQQALCQDLIAYTNTARDEYAAFKETVNAMIFGLIRDGKQAGMIDTTLGDEIVFHYIRMGLCYYQNDPVYRERMHADTQFRKSLLDMMWRNIFTEDGLKNLGSMGYRGYEK